MFSDAQLQRLVRLTENIAEREVDAGQARKPTAQTLSKESVAPIVAYLLEPYEAGYWELKAEWNSSSPLAKYLLSKLGTTTDVEKDGESVYMPGIARKLTEEKRAELLRVTTRLTAIMALFRRAKFDEDGGPSRVSEIDSWIERINLAELRVEFSEAYQIFSDRIYFEGILTAFTNTKPYRTKSGLLTLLDGPSALGPLSVVGMNRLEVEALRDFFHALGVIEKNTIQRVFAPDEVLFKPYFSLVSAVLDHVVHDSHISRVFLLALAYYEEEDFQHCISSLGLIAEDYIQRVYTTLLREPLPGNHTLGQTLERLNRRLEDLLPQPKSTQKSPDSVYDMLKNLPENAYGNDLAPVIRELMQVVLEDRKHFGKRLDDVTKPVGRRTVFPPRVTDLLNELLKWRNAASHNSRIPLGAHEADRTLYCLVSVITWWQRQLATQNWEKSRVEVIETLLAAARP